MGETRELGEPTHISCEQSEFGPGESYTCTVQDKLKGEKETVTVDEVDIFAGDSDHHLQQIRQINANASYDDGGFRVNLQGTMECQYEDDDFEGRTLTCDAD